MKEYSLKTGLGIAARVPVKGLEIAVKAVATLGVLAVRGYIARRACKQIIENDGGFYNK